MNRTQDTESTDLPIGTADVASRAGLAEPALAYDYFKSMASVSVATLGGILTLGETVFGARIAPWQMGLAALPVAISGVLALQGKTDVMQLCQGMKPPLNSSRMALRLVPALYGIGLGVFLVFLMLSYLSPEDAARLGSAGSRKPVCIQSSSATPIRSPDPTSIRPRPRPSTIVIDT